MWGAFGATVALLVAGLVYQDWRIDGLKDKVALHKQDAATHEANFDTCKATNKTNAATIERQRDSIRQFMLAQDEALERNRKLAEELAARQLADNEQSEAVRNEVSEILSAEACGAVEHPARVHRLLNDAIAKASGRGDGGG